MGSLLWCHLASPDLQGPASLGSIFCLCVLSCFSCVWLFVTSWTVACQAPWCIGFSRQEYWSELLCPPPVSNPCLLLSPVLVSQVVVVVKKLPANAGDERDEGLIPGLGRSPGGGPATYPSILVWRIPWTEEPSRLQSKGLHRVEHSWSDFSTSPGKPFAH